MIDLAKVKERVAQSLKEIEGRVPGNLFTKVEGIQNYDLSDSTEFLFAGERVEELIQTLKRITNKDANTKKAEYMAIYLRGLLWVYAIEVAGSPEKYLAIGEALNKFH